MDWHAISGIVMRGLNHLALICAAFLSLEYASLAEINIGVISSLYTSGVIFTSILFYFIYGESLTGQDFLGMLIIISGGVLIGIGKPSNDS